MSMRATALVLVLTLTGPAVAVSVCELFCAHAAHHEGSAAASGCHEQYSAGAGPILVPAAAACHETSELPSDVIAVAAQQAPAPATTLDVAPTLVVPAGARRQRHAAPTIRDTGPSRTQLRI
jgi:hypothetical protein